MARTIRWLAAAVLGISVCGGCGDRTPETGIDVDLETPSATVARFIRAVSDGDVETYLSLLPTQDRMRAEASRQAAGEHFDATLRGSLDSMERMVAGAEVVDERISGSTAVVTVRNRAGSDISWRCVREPDGWKVAVGQ